jgi:hypothetical protein
MTEGRFHYTVTVDGELITVDFRDPIVPAVRRVQAGEARPGDTADILDWWATHAIASANCRRGACNHTVV